MFGRMVAGLRSRNLTRRPLEYRAASFSQLMRALETIERTRSQSTVLRASTVRLIAPIVFEETVTYPSGFAGVSIVSEPSLDHKLASGVSTAFSVRGNYHRFLSLAFKEADGTMVSPSAVLTTMEIRQCVCRLTNLYSSSLLAVGVAICDNQGIPDRGIITGGLSNSIVSRNLLVQNITSNGVTWSKNNISHNLVSDDIVIDAGGDSVIVGNTCDNITTNAGSGANLISANNNTGRTSHGTDIVNGDNAV